MAVNNSLQPQNKKNLPFSVAIRQEKWQDLIHNTLGNEERAGRFVASITSAVAVSPAIQTCDAGTVLSAALLGEVLNLSPSPQLGHFYMVPYKQKEKRDRDGNVLTPERTVAQFQIGYKGMLQLAVRSGYYRKIVVLPIKEGELLHWNPMEEEIAVNLIDDEERREAAPTIGYYAMFEYVGGSFRKIMYWSKAKMEQHADRYSQAFSLTTYRKILNGEIPERDMWKYSSFWYKDFDSMAQKTMLRQLISKWGIMSIELQKAFNADEAVIKDNLTPEYLDPEGNAPGGLASPNTDALPPAGEPGVTEELPEGIFGGEAQQPVA